MINSKIIKIASNTRFNELFNEFTHKSNIKNKKCGDTITIELIVKNVKIIIEIIVRVFFIKCYNITVCYNITYTNARDKLR